MADLLYNGVLLPEGRKATAEYPYQALVLNDDMYHLFTVSEPLGVYGSSGLVVLSSPTTGYDDYIKNADGYDWFDYNAVKSFSWTMCYGATIIWANHDLVDESNRENVVFKGSEPVDPNAPTITNITISSSSADSLICGTNTSLSVTVEGTNDFDSSVTYIIEGATSADTVLTASTETEGVYILTCGEDEKAETLTITFTSVQDPTFTATKTITVQQVPTVIFDLRSWLMGFTLGIAGKPLPFGRALWYSYNGTILNALPYWDESKYPYAVITSFTILDTTAYKLWLFEEPMMVYSVEGSDLPTFRAGDTDVPYMMDTCKIGYSDSGSNKWEGLKNMTITANSDATTGAIVWSNYDITLEDGTVYVEGSEPVPYCGQKIEPPEEEKTPVAYMYNDVRLPDINEAYEVIATQAGVDVEIAKASFPYALVIYNEAENENRLFLCNTTPYGRDGICMLPSETYLGIFDTDGNSWGYTVELPLPDGGTLGYAVKWTSHDILNADGTIYLAASDPIPVYE